MFIKQLSVFVENRFGAVADIVSLLSENEINIRALSVADTTDYGIMRLIIDKPDDAKQILRDKGIMVKMTEVLAVPLQDNIGGLSYVLDVFKQSGISIDYIYAFVGRNHGKAVVVIKAEDMDGALHALNENGITSLSLSDVQ